MDEALITAIARALCRSARIGPDSILPPETEPEYPGSMSPAVNPMPAWERFRAAAQNYCEARSVFVEAAGIEMHDGWLSYRCRGPHAFFVRSIARPHVSPANWIVASVALAEEVELFAMLTISGIRGVHA